jgi:hypothetical protein
MLCGMSRPRYRCKAFAYCAWVCRAKSRTPIFLTVNLTVQGGKMSKIDWLWLSPCSLEGNHVTVCPPIYLCCKGRSLCRGPKNETEASRPMVLDDGIDHL